MQHEPTLLDAVGLANFKDALSDDGRPVASFCLLIIMYSSLSIVLNIGQLPHSNSSQQNLSGDLYTGLLANETKSAATAPTRNYDSQSLESSESNAIPIFQRHDTRDVATTTARNSSGLRTSAMPTGVFLVTTTLWSLWFPSISALPVMLHSVLSLITLGSEFRAKLLSVTVLRLILVYISSLLFVYCGFSMPYIYEYITLGCASNSRANVTTNPCSRDAVAKLRPERWATFWGIGWAVPNLNR